MIDQKEQIRALEELGDYIANAQPEHVVATKVTLGELVVQAQAAGIVRLLMFLRDDANCACKMLLDVCGVDYPERENRFDVVYNILSLSHNLRIRIKIATDEHTPVSSVVSVYPAAGWFEREVWDMYGVRFENHPDLRRMLSDYGFRGHPLRKDFPLTGYVECRYDEQEKRVVYEPVKLTQEYRNFDFVSPWEGIQSVLPGDEKAEGAE
jgi:NADH-quinone oxidoreductase subunit C